MNPVQAALTLGVGVGAAALLFGDANMSDPQTNAEQRNLDAWLALMGEGEGGAEGYHALVGGGRFEDFSDHPAVTGEFEGIPTRDGRDITTAAGKWQITRRTWLDLGGKARYGDFGPDAQRAATCDLIKRRGAWALVLRGDAAGAAYALRNEWEMFQQPQWDAERVAARFEALGGTLA